MGSWGEQFSTGDQGDFREQFFKGNRKIYPSCGGQDIKMETHVAGCRHNGDGYGTEVFTCGKCNWTTSFQYDEQGDTYYYEMAYLWRKPEPARAPSPVKRRKPTTKEKFEWENMWHYHSIPMLRSSLLGSYYCEEDIEQFTQEMVEKEAPKPKQVTPMTPSLLAKYTRIAKLLPEADARYNMEQEGLSKESIDQFFAEQGHLV